MQRRSSQFKSQLLRKESEELTFFVIFCVTTEELADALLADEMRKSSVTSIQTQAQVHSPIGASTTGFQSSLPTGPVTSTPRSGLSIGSGDSGIGETSSEASGVSIEKVQHQLAITTQELMETKEALENSEKTITELKGRGEAGGKIHVDLRFKMRPCLKKK